MTPPQAATNVAAPPSIGVPRRSLSEFVASTGGRWLQPRAWARLRLIVDIVVLYLAAGVTLFAATPMSRLRGRVVGGDLPARRTRVDARPPNARRRLERLAARHVHARLGRRVTRGDADDRHRLDLRRHPSAGPGAPAMAVLPSSTWVWPERSLLSIRRRAMRSGAHATPTLIVGAGMIGAHLVKRLIGEPSYGLRPVGFLDADPLPGIEPATGPSVPILGGPDRLGEAIATTGARHVILAFSSGRDQMLVSKVRQCEQLGIDVSLDSATVRVDQRAHHARARWRSAAVVAALDRSPGLAVRAQACDGPKLRAAGAPGDGPGDDRDGDPGAPVVSRARALPSAQSRARRP